jgi:sucrose-6-phosphate hydrolase SacC (GH32 family)
MNTQADAHTPRYHLTSPTNRNLCFDPNGGFYHNGRYHLFHIFQNPDLRTGDAFPQRGHSWGHLSSADLVHWHRHPTALSPDPRNPETAIYSGCAILDKNNTPTLIYHGFNSGTSLATPVQGDNSFDHWQKHPQNPVIPEPKSPSHPGFGIYNVFDSCVWLEDQTYYAILGGKTKPHDLHDTAYLFSSPDLIHWQYLHPLYTPSHQWTTDRDDCACPKFFSINKRHYLVCISHATGLRYYAGSYANHLFTPDQHHPMNFPGGCAFAPEIIHAPNNRKLLWAWALDQRTDWYKEGRTGVLTLPRDLSPGPNGTLNISPAPELQALRTNHRTLQNLTLTPSHSIPLQNINTQSLELSLTLTWTSPAIFALKIHASPDDAEQTLITFDTASRALSIDATQTTLANDGFRPWPLDFWQTSDFKNTPIQTAPVPLNPQTPNSLTLRLFLDRSILELFADDSLCLTQRLYPTRPDSHHASLHALHGQIHIPDLDAWDMNPITIA